MNNKVLLLTVLLAISACDDVPGQYRHDKNHHDQQDQQDQQNSELESLQNQK